MARLNTAIDAPRENRTGGGPWQAYRVLSPSIRLIAGLIAGPKTGVRPLARLERVLSVGRAFLTSAALTAIYLDPTQPSRLAAITYGVLAAYAVYSLAVLIYVHRTARLSVTHVQILHGFDVLWAAALTFVSEGPVIRSAFGTWSR